MRRIKQKLRKKYVIVKTKITKNKLNIIKILKHLGLYTINVIVIVLMLTIVIYLISEMFLSLYQFDFFVIDNSAFAVLSEIDFQSFFINFLLFASIFGAMWIVLRIGLSVFKFIFTKHLMILWQPMQWIVDNYKTSTVILRNLWMAFTFTFTLLTTLNSTLFSLFSTLISFFVIGFTFIDKFNKE